MRVSSTRRYSAARNAAGSSPAREERPAHTDRRHDSGYHSGQSLEKATPRHRDGDRDRWASDRPQRRRRSPTRSRSRTGSPSHGRSRARSRARSRSRSPARGRVRSRSRSPARGRARSHSRSPARGRARSRAGNRASSHSRSDRDRSESPLTLLEAQLLGLVEVSSDSEPEPAPKPVPKKPIKRVKVAAAFGSVHLAETDRFVSANCSQSPLVIMVFPRQRLIPVRGITSLRWIHCIFGLSMAFFGVICMAALDKHSWDRLWSLAGCFPCCDLSVLQDGGIILVDITACMLHQRSYLKVLCV
jgi:hypothetical protein